MCICDFNHGCGGLGIVFCDGCGGDLCVCHCGGEMDCPGCLDCDGDRYSEDHDDFGEAES